MSMLRLDRLEGATSKWASGLKRHAVFGWECGMMCCVDLRIDAVLLLLRPVLSSWWVVPDLLWLCPNVLLVVPQ